MLSRIQKLLPSLFLLGLFTWGVYVTFFFIGIDGHIVVLLRDTDWQSIAREIAHPFQRGLAGFMPFMGLLLERLKPFTAYAVVCLLLYGALIGLTIFRRGKLYFDLRLSALHVFLFGIVSLWLLATTMFYGGIPGMQPRLLIEPTEEVYGDAHPEGLAVLKGNFERLRDSGCLREDPLKRTSKGARVFRYRGLCMQKTFVLRSLGLLGMLVFIVLNFLVLGRLFLRILALRPSSRITEFIVSLGVGAALLTAVLWLLALLHVLTAAFAWAILLLVPAAAFRETRFWLRTAVRESWTFRAPFHSVTVLLFWLLVSYIAFNFFTVIRPFPIGWDDLGRYINMPRQLSSFGHGIPNIPAIQWEYVTSLGFVLFGYFSEFGAVLAQQINWAAGVLAVLAVYGCTRMVLGPGAGLLAALFYYGLPMVGHFSFADMKTENVLLFFGTVGLMAVFQSLTSPTSLKWLLVAGLLFAAGFATKVTVILFFFMGGVILAWGMLGAVSGIGAMLLSLAVLGKAGAIDVDAIAGRVAGGDWSWIQLPAIVLLALGGALLLFLPFSLPVLTKRGTFHAALLRRFLVAVLLLLAGFFAYTAPWLASNMAAHGRFAPMTALKAPNTITPRVSNSAEALPAHSPPGSRNLSAELAVDPDHEMCKSTAGTEELDRYWGYGSGIGHYAGLPWRVVMNIDSQGYYLTTSPLLLLVPLILLLPLFWRPPRRLLRLLFFGTALYSAEWIVVGNGIPWYGIGLFLGLAIAVEALVALAPGKTARIAAGALVAIAIGTAFSLRLWQFGMQKNLYEYAWGKASAAVLGEMTIPDYDDIADRVMELSKNPDRPYLYRMGTFISYFIPRNLEIIVLNDNQLEFFNCLNQEGDHALTLRRLQALGIHSIVFDTNTATIEKDPEGTLHQKVRRFLAFANDPSLDIVSVVNNPGAGIAYMILP